MGLDLTVLAKPREGSELEFEDLWRKIHVANGNIPDPGKNIITRFFGIFAKAIDTAPLINRFHNITIPAYAVLNAPIVGRDSAADEWLLSLQLKDTDQNTNGKEFLEDMQGYHVIELVDDCDGFPIYSNAYSYDGVDRTSFRGSFLEICADVIGKNLVKQAWVPMLAHELSDYGARLMDCALKYSEQHGVSHVIGDKNYDWENEKGPDAKAHIVDQAARWCLFWSKRGYGSEPFY